MNPETFRFVATFATEFIAQVTRLADAQQRLAEASEAGLKLSQQHVSTQEQMASSSAALEATLLASMTPKTPKSGGRGAPGR